LSVRFIREFTHKRGSFSTHIEKIGREMIMKLPIGVQA